MKAKRFTPRVLVLLLALTIGLPPPTFALREPQKEDPSQLAGLEEALRDPEGTLRRIAQLVTAPVSTPVSPQPRLEGSPIGAELGASAGLEEAADREAFRNALEELIRAEQEQKEAAHTGARRMRLEDIEDFGMERVLGWHRRLEEAGAAYHVAVDAVLRYVQLEDIAFDPQGIPQLQKGDLIVVYGKDRSHNSIYRYVEYDTTLYPGSETEKLNLRVAFTGVGTHSIDVRWQPSGFFEETQKGHIRKIVLPAGENQTGLEEVEKVRKAIADLTHPDPVIRLAAQKTVHAVVYQEIVGGPPKREVLREALAEAVAPSIENLYQFDPSLRLAAQETVHAIADLGIGKEALAEMVAPSVRSLSSSDPSIRYHAHCTLVILAREGIAKEELARATRNIRKLLSHSKWAISNSAREILDYFAERGIAEISGRKPPSTTGLEEGYYTELLKNARNIQHVSTEGGKHFYRSVDDIVMLVTDGENLVIGIGKYPTHSLRIRDEVSEGFRVFRLILRDYTEPFDLTEPPKVQWMDRQVAPLIDDIAYEITGRNEALLTITVVPRAEGISELQLELPAGDFPNEQWIFSGTGSPLPRYPELFPHHQMYMHRYTKSIVVRLQKLSPTASSGAPPTAGLEERMPAWMQAALGTDWMEVVYAVHEMAEVTDRVAVLLQPELLGVAEDDSDTETALMGMGGNLHGAFGWPEQTELRLGLFTPKGIAAFEAQGYRVIRIIRHPESEETPLPWEAVPIVVAEALADGRPTFWVNVTPYLNLRGITLPEVLATLTELFA